MGWRGGGVAEWRVRFPANEVRCHFLFFSFLFFFFFPLFLMPHISFFHLLILSSYHLIIFSFSHIFIFSKHSTPRSLEVASKSIRPILRYETNKMEILGCVIIERFIEIFERFIFEWSVHVRMSAGVFLQMKVTGRN
jgi:hypothetical protein